MALGFSTGEASRLAGVEERHRSCWARRGDVAIGRCGRRHRRLAPLLARRVKEAAIVKEVSMDGSGREGEWMRSSEEGRPLS